MLSDYHDELSLPMDLCSMKVRTGTFQTGPRRKPMTESTTHSPEDSAALADARRRLILPSRGSRAELDWNVRLGATELRA